MFNLKSIDFFLYLLMGKVCFFFQFDGYHMIFKVLNSS